MNEKEFNEWWCVQNTRLGTAYRFAAWNTWVSRQPEIDVLNAKVVEFKAKLKTAADRLEKLEIELALAKSGSERFWMIVKQLKSEQLKELEKCAKMVDHILHWGGAEHMGMSCVQGW